MPMTGIGKWAAKLVVIIILLTVLVVYFCIFHNLNTRRGIWLLPATLGSTNRRAIDHLHSTTPPRLLNASKCSPDLNLIPPLYTFDLVVPVEPPGSELFRVLLPTLLFFWPLSRTNLVVVTDAEIGEQRRREFAREYHRETRGLNSSRVVFAAPSAVYRRDVNGRIDAAVTDSWFRQMWLRLWTDNFTSADFVGFSDTDAILTAVPIVGDIFAIDASSGTTPTRVRPVVHCQYFHRPTYPLLVRYLSRTAEALRRPAVLDCGTFPLVFRLQHLRQFRAHIVRLHGYATFDAFFAVFQRRAFSEFMLLFNYIWYYHRADYDWSIMPIATAPMNRQAWTLMNRSVAMAVLNVSQDALLPKARIGQHRNFIKTSLRHVMKAGRCFYMSALGHKTPNCRPIVPNRAVVNDLLYFYEGFSWNNMSDVKRSYSARISLIKRRGHRHCWNLSLL